MSRNVTFAAVTSSAGSVLHVASAGHGAHTILTAPLRSSGPHWPGAHVCTLSSRITHRGYSAAAQRSHSTELSRLVKRGGTHSLHSALFSVDANVFAGQAVQDRAVVACALPRYVPRLQGMQLRLPRFGVKKPTSQSSHDEARCWSLNLPSGHSEHSGAFEVAEKRPSPHSAQRSWSTTDSPGAHSRSRTGNVAGSITSHSN